MQAAGLKSIFPMSDLAVMLLDVFGRPRTLMRRINEAAAAILREKPDIVLSIDSPGFVKRVVKKVKNSTLHTSRSTLFYHVVAPQVWAWGAHRAKKYASIFDRMYAFFDFEVPYFTEHGLATIPVGHPIADGLPPAPKVKDKVGTITLLPGSRMSEVKKLMPVFKNVVCHLPKYKYVLPVVETTEKYVQKHIKNWPIKPTIIPARKRYEQYSKTDIAIVAVGTATAELAMMHVPVIVVYKTNAITQFIARRVIRLKHLSLVNILLGRKVYPELLGDDCAPETIVREIEKLKDAPARQKMISQLSRADKMWQRKVPAAKLIAEDIIKNAA
jgi:lipid-A-disaccharide synthase